jgi:hypothetical protein
MDQFQTEIILRLREIVIQTGDQRRAFEKDVNSLRGFYRNHF